MPTYEYSCTACGNEFERFESITAKPNKECPKCKKKKAERRISGGGGFLFKGSGFYVTDYRKSSGAPKTETKTDTKTETKTESKTDSKPSTDTKPSSEPKGCASDSGGCKKSA